MGTQFLHLSSKQASTIWGSKIVYLASWLRFNLMALKKHFEFPKFATKSTWVITLTKIKHLGFQALLRTNPCS